MSNAAEIRNALTNPVQLCAALGIERGARWQAKGITILCPLHKEETPSCSITTGQDGTIRAKCFGCDFTGDALTLVAAVRGLDLVTQFDRILEEAGGLAGIEVTNPHNAGAGSVNQEPERISPQTYNAIAQALLELCPLDSDADVLGYVDRRILLVQAGRAQCGALPRPELQAVIIARLCDAFTAESLVDAGLLWKDEGTGEIKRAAFLAPQNRLIVPWRGLDGSITCLQRRRLDDQKERKYVFPPGMRPPLPFGAEVLRAHDADRTLVFVEGALDVLALRLLDWRDALGIVPLGMPGVDGWRSDWARFAKGRAVRIGLDADDPGERKVQTIADDLCAAGIATIERWTPRAKDWCSVVEEQVNGSMERAR